MPTKAELTDRIKRDLARKDRSTLTALVVRDALLGAPAPDRDGLIAAIIDEDNARAGSIINSIVTGHLEDLAQTEADSLLADDALTITELSRWLDP